MSNEVQTTGSNLPANPEALLSGLANMNRVADQDASGQFMNFKKGNYVYGAESIDVEEASLWAVNPNSFIHGYQAWGNKKLLEEQIAGMNEPPIQKSNLQTHMYVHPETGTEVAAKWAPYRGFVLVCVSGEDEGVQCLFATSSVGGKGAVDKLVSAIVGHVREDPGTPVAIIELGTDSYTHKEHGEIFFPIFEVVEWADMDATEVPDSEDEPEGAAEGETSEADEAEAEARANADAIKAEAEAAEAAKAAKAAKAEEVKPARSRRGRGAAKAEPEKTEQVRTRRRRGV